jgi:hypothetical protein
LVSRWVHKSHHAYRFSAPPCSGTFATFPPKCGLLVPHLEQELCLLLRFSVQQHPRARLQYPLHLYSECGPSTRWMMVLEMTSGFSARRIGTLSPRWLRLCREFGALSQGFWPRVMIVPPDLHFSYLAPCSAGCWVRVGSVRLPCAAE